MKFTKKKVFVAALAICLIAILSMGSLAWFNANDEVTNTFKVADSDDPDTAPDFSVKVDETNNSTEAGAPDRTEDGNTYENILPGDVKAKDPRITNTSTSYDQYIRVNFIISKAFADQVAEVQGVTYDNLDLTKLFSGFNANLTDREVAPVGTFADYYVYAYYYNEKLAAKDYFTAFTAVNIPENFVQSDMAYGTFDIKVNAEAIQTQNLGEDVDTAKEAFAAVDWGVGTNYDYPAKDADEVTAP